MRVRAFAGIAVAATAATAALPAQADDPPRKVVRIYDNFYLPDEMKVKRDTVVVWKWPNDTGDVHDVKLKEKPKGAKRFASDPASVGYKFKRKLTVPGKYHIICTLHEEMEMNITVRKRRA
jgi:plastocyanin